MKSDRRLIDRVIAWFIHWSSGIPVSAKKVSEEQITPTEVHSGGLPRDVTSRNMSNGGDVDASPDREGGEPRNERYIRCNGFEVCQEA